MNPIEISSQHMSEDKSKAAVDLYRHLLGVGTEWTVKRRLIYCPIKGFSKR
jgi:hypothetical protein